TVTPVNDVPSFTKGANQTVLEDAAAQTITAWATNISAGSNETGQTLNFIVSNNNTALFSGQPTVAANGTLTYTPTASANGSATVTVQVHDNGGTTNGGVDTSAAQTFTITVTPVNDAPVAVNDAYSVNEDTILTLAAPGVLGNDTDIDSATITAAVVTNPAHGTLALSANGSFTYTPAANYNGPDSFTYKANDGALDSNAATATITVTAVNDAPSFTKGADQTVLEDAAAQSVTAWATIISAGPADEVGQTLNFIVSNNNTTLFSAQPAVSASGTLTYTPAANANGSATVTVQVHDSGGTTNGGVDTSAAQTFTITVTPVDDVPSFTKGANQTVLEDAAAQTITAWATAISAGANETGQTLNFIVSNNNATLFSGQPAVAANGTLTYTPAANANGSATVTVQVHDNGGTTNGGVDTSAAQTFTVTVTPVNDAPVAVNDAYSVNEDTILTVAAPGVLANDADAEANPLTAALVTGPAHGTLAFNANGSFTYTPAANYNGPDSFTYKANDGALDSTAGTATITVTAVNDVPSFTKGADQTVLEDD